MIIKKNFFILLFFVTIFSTGLILYKDYGVSFDEKFHRENGSFWYKYSKNFLVDNNSTVVKDSEKLIKEKISENNFIETVPSIQPVPFVIISELFLDILNINKSTKSIYQFRHFFNFIIYFIGLIFFYKLILKRYRSSSYAFLGVLILFLTPRIFAESFYNQKDIFFLVTIIINMYTGINYIENPSKKNTFAFSISSALTIDTRIIGLISVLIFLFLIFLKSIKDNLFFKKIYISIISFFILTFFFIIIFWPYLWHDPFNNLFFALSKLSSVNFGYSVLYLGQYILSTNIPWHYPIVWIGVTTPTIVILFFLTGTLFFSKRIFSRTLKLNNNQSDFWKSNDEFFDIYFFAMFFIPIFLYIKKSLGYDGWRHLYFIYPSMIIIFLYGFYRLRLLFTNTYIKLFFSSLIIINLFYLIIWNYKYHPHQNVYFNFFSKQKFHNNFEKDYWGLSNKASLEYIINNSSSYPSVVTTISFSSLEMSSLILDENEKNKISITHNIDEAEFIVTNYRPLIKRNFIIDKNKYKKYYEILVDGVPINTVYKKVN
tara:strand:- start:2679 stop:4307 length:1629 start_codon:yes stop_codon:yes gene_type:complete